MDILEELRNEHEQILEALYRVVAIGITTEEAQRSLAELKDLMLDHHRKEDELLYPRMKGLSTDNFIFKCMLKMLDAEINSASEAVSGFYDKYPNGGSGNEFVRDFNAFFSAVKERTAKEENIIFEEYQNLLNISGGTSL